MKFREVLITAQLFNIKASQMRLFQKAVSRMEEVLGSTIFFETLNHYILTQGTSGELSHWKEKDTLEIYENLFSFRNGNKRLMNLIIHSYYTSKNVLGYGLPSDDIIRVNTKYTDLYNENNEHHLKAVGSNLLHEESHNCEFSHAFRRTNNRHTSLSYLLNKAYEDTYDRLFIPHEFRKVTICSRPWYTLGLLKKCSTETRKVYI